MKKLFFLILLTSLCFISIAQINLIPNPSFEQDTACPDQLSQLYKLKNWYKINTTPDYFNRCYYGVNNYAFIPKNLFGYQDVINPCHSYIGLIAFNPTTNGTTNEIIGVKLNSQLSIGTKYYFSMKVSLANNCKRAQNNLGVTFSNTQPVSSLTSTPTNSCNITFTQTVVDTMNWVTLFKSFVATSNFEYISIGNFFDTLSTSRIFLYNSPYPDIYYFIDDVCLSTDSAFAYDYNFNCLTTSLHEQEKNNFTIYPNPSKNNVKYESKEDIMNIELYDVNFKKQLFTRKDEELFFDLPSGIYFLEVKFNNYKTTFKKLIINQ